MGKVSSISQFDGVVYYKYNEISTVQFKLYRMLDPTTGNSLAPDAKCDTWTLLTSSDGYLVSSISDDISPVDDRYTSL